MGLGIEKFPTHEIWDIPVVGIDLETMQPNWDDNSWIVQHLRQLADKIEAEQPKIYSMGFDAACQYSPKIYLKVFPKRKTN